MGTTPWTTWTLPVPMDVMAARAFWTSAAVELPYRATGLVSPWKVTVQVAACPPSRNALAATGPEAPER